MIPEEEYRFDRVPVGQEFPALIWEAGRIAKNNESTKNSDGFAFRALHHWPAFPSTPWLRLTTIEREKTVERWAPSVLRKMDGADLLHWMTEKFPQPTTPDAWRSQLAKAGCVILHFGYKGRYTRAEMRGLFEDWLDGAADWCAPVKKAAVFGRHTAADGLRAIAWTRLADYFASNPDARGELTVIQAALRIAKSNTSFREWLRPRSSAAKLSKWKAEARDWMRWVACGETNAPSS